MSIDTLTTTEKVLADRHRTAVGGDGNLMLVATVPKYIINASRL